jgi:CheY-like chemotaxis protein
VSTGYTDGMSVVLVVDDDAVVRQVLADGLTDAGYAVQLATNGQEALDVLRTGSPDLIVLDLLMPVMDGWRFIESYRALVHNRPLPIVTLSANPGPPRSYQQLGVRAHVRKPFQLDGLVDTLQAVAQGA